MEYKNLPDLRALATLREIVERGGVAEAGRVLNIGQPAVTKRLRALERCFGIELMVRHGGRLRLTEAGERVYAFARLVMDHQVELTSDLKQLKAGRDRLRLAHVDHQVLDKTKFGYHRYGEFYRGLDCVVITSELDCGPLCLFEAMRCGVPVLSTRVGWAQYLVQDGATGWLYDGVEELADKLREVYEHRAAWFARRHVIRSVVERWTLEGWIDESVSFCAQLASKRQGDQA